MAESPLRSDTARLFVVFGVAGCGKSTIGRAWAEAIGATYLEGDEFHPPGNIDKMSRGEPLDDADRWPWLERFGRSMVSRPGRVVGACSALKRAYRDRITEVAGEPVLFIHLDGDRELIGKRMQARQGHYMPVSLLDSQFADFEPPQADENIVSIDISGDSSDILDQIQQKLSGRIQ